MSGMKNRISLKKEFYPEIQDSEMPPVAFVKQAIIDEPSLKEGEDYFLVGEDVYIYLKTALFLIGRFAITNISRTLKSIGYLAEPAKKGYYNYNDDCLPGLDSTEQEWNDKILPQIKDKAKFLSIEYLDFLKIIYSNMRVNWPYYTGLYLEKHGLPGETKVTKFRIVTCNKELRIRFESAMQRVINCDVKPTGLPVG